MRTGTPIEITNLHGRPTRVLLLEVNENGAIARTRDGHFQALRKNGNTWTCVKMPNSDESKVRSYLESRKVAIILSAGDGEI